MEAKILMYSHDSRSWDFKIRNKYVKLSNKIMRVGDTNFIQALFYIGTKSIGTVILINNSTFL